MRLKELRGLPVIDPTAARKIGTVQDYQIDPASGRLAA
ncbi:MAG: PRC-barrel domain-containing protein, partial [Chloroflexi bacterium]|nr:PRC-barrel domain-containing protein [Chloroflexota bacterium]